MSSKFKTRSVLIVINTTIAEISQQLPSPTFLPGFVSSNILRHTKIRVQNKLRFLFAANDANNKHKMKTQTPNRIARQISQLSHRGKCSMMFIFLTHWELTSLKHLIIICLTWKYYYESLPLLFFQTSSSIHCLPSSNAVLRWTLIDLLIYYLGLKWKSVDLFICDRKEAKRGGTLKPSRVWNAEANGGDCGRTSKFSKRPACRAANRNVSGLSP